MPYFRKKLALCLTVMTLSVTAQEQELPKIDYTKEKQVNTKALESGLANSEQFETQEYINWVDKVKNSATAKQKSEALAIIQSTPTELFTKALKDIDESNPVLAEIKKGSNVITPKLKAGKKNTRYGDIDAYILVSLSMPKVSLQRLYLESVYQFPDKNIVFLFRGYDAPHLKEFMSELYQSVESIENAPSIAIDPTVFRALDVKEVPYFALKNKKGVWKKVLGDVSITQAIDEAENQYSDTYVGRTYPIKEQDILSYIEKKINAYDFDKDIKTTTSNLMSDRFDADLIVATESRKYYVDPTTTIKKAIMDRGKVIVAPGTQINPLKYMPLTKDYVFIDATDKAQVKIAKSWQKKNKRMVVITTKMPKSESTLKIIVDNFDKLYEVDPLLKRRFGITHIPSKVSQKGLVLEVTVAKVEKPEKYEEEL
jgi:conjugal transfer pilus assembly protein TraW